MTSHALYSFPLLKSVSSSFAYLTHLEVDFDFVAADWFQSFRNYPSTLTSLRMPFISFSDPLGLTTTKIKMSMQSDTEHQNYKWIFFNELFPDLRELCLDEFFTATTRQDASQYASWKFWCSKLPPTIQKLRMKWMSYSAVHLLHNIDHLTHLTHLATSPVTIFPNLLHFSKLETLEIINKDSSSFNLVSYKNPINFNETFPSSLTCLHFNELSFFDIPIPNLPPSVTDLSLRIDSDPITHYSKDQCIRIPPGILKLSIYGAGDIIHRLRFSSSSQLESIEFIDKYLYIPMIPIGQIAYDPVQDHFLDYDKIPTSITHLKIKCPVPHAENVDFDADFEVDYYGAPDFYHNLDWNRYFPNLASLDVSIPMFLSNIKNIPRSVKNLDISIHPFEVVDSAGLQTFLSSKVSPNHIAWKRSQENSSRPVLLYLSEFSIECNKYIQNISMPISNWNWPPSIQTLNLICFQSPFYSLSPVDETLARRADWTHLLTDTILMNHSLVNSDFFPRTLCRLSIDDLESDNFVPFILRHLLYLSRIESSQTVNSSGDATNIGLDGILSTAKFQSELSFAKSTPTFNPTVLSMDTIQHYTNYLQQNICKNASTRLKLHGTTSIPKHLQTQNQESDSMINIIETISGSKSIASAQIMTQEQMIQSLQKLKSISILLTSSSVIGGPFPPTEDFIQQFPIMTNLERFHYEVSFIKQGSIINAAHLPPNIIDVNITNLSLPHSEDDIPIDFDSAADDHPLPKSDQNGSSTQSSVTRHHYSTYQRLSSLEVCGLINWGRSPHRSITFGQLFSNLITLVTYYMPIQALQNLNHLTTLRLTGDIEEWNYYSGWPMVDKEFNVVAPTSTHFSSPFPRSLTDLTLDYPVSDLILMDAPPNLQILTANNTTIRLAIVKILMVRNPLIKLTFSKIRVPPNVSRVASWESLLGLENSASLVAFKEHGIAGIDDWNLASSVTSFPPQGSDPSMSIPNSHLTYLPSHIASLHLGSFQAIEVLGNPILYLPHSITSLISRSFRPSYLLGLAQNPNHNLSTIHVTTWNVCDSVDADMICNPVLVSPSVILRPSSNLVFIVHKTSLYKSKADYLAAQELSRMDAAIRSTPVTIWCPKLDKVVKNVRRYRL